METINVPGDGLYAVVRPTFSPKDYSNLTVTAAKSLIPQLRAAEPIETAFLKMLDGDRNVRSWNFIKKIAPHGDQAVKDYAVLCYFFGSPWLGGGDFSKIPLTQATKDAIQSAVAISKNYHPEIEEAYESIKDDFISPTALPNNRPLFLNLVTLNGKRIETANDTAFVKHILQEESKECEKLSPAEKAARAHPLLRWDTRLDVGADGKGGPSSFKEETYFDAFKSDLVPAANLYLDAAKIVSGDYPIYSYILAKISRALIDGNNMDGLDVMLVKNDSPLVTLTGPIEQYVLTQMDRTLPVEKAGLRTTLAIKNEAGTAKLKSFEENLPALIATVPKEYRNQSVPKISMQIIDVIHAGAESSRFGKTFLGEQLPNDTYNNSIAPIIFSFDNSIVQKTQAVHAAVADALMPPELRAKMDVLAAERNNVYVHELGHVLGVRNIYVPHLEEAKANAVAVRRANVAGISGEALDHTYLHFPINMIRTVRLGITPDLKKVEGAHAIANNMLLNFAYYFGGLNVIDGAFCIDVGGLNKGLDDFLTQAYLLAYNGNKEPINKFTEQWNYVDPKTKWAIQTLHEKKAPKEIIAIYEEPTAIIKKLDDFIAAAS